MSQLDKTRCISVPRAAIMAALAFAFAGHAQANLISDGSFEGNETNQPNNSSYGIGSTFIPAWTVVGAEGRNVQWIHNGTYTSINAFDGVGLIDLTGNPDNGPAGLQQSFATTNGTAYRATFYLGYAQVSQGFGGPVSATVSLGGDQAQLFTAGPGNGQQTSTVWTPFTYDFTATSASTLLRIVGTSSAGVFLGLDAVDVELGPTVTPPPIVVDPVGNGTVPEPASLALLGLGIVGGLVARRRAIDATRG